MVRILLTLTIAVSSLLSLTPVLAQDNPWMVRFRAVHINWDNGQKDGLTTGAGGVVEAKNLTIPEVDFTYFFTKNVAAELVLTYPQKVDVDVSGGQIGTIKALPPSLLLQYHFTDYGAFKPYVGLGVNYTRFTDRDNLMLGGTTRLTVDKSSFGYAAQVGFDYMVDKNWGFNFDVKYAKIETDIRVASTGAKAGKLDLSPVMAGVGVTYKY